MNFLKFTTQTRGVRQVCATAHTTLRGWHETRIAHVDHTRWHSPYVAMCRLQRADGASLRELPEAASLLACLRIVASGRLRRVVYRAACVAGSVAGRAARCAASRIAAASPVNTLFTLLPLAT